MFDYPEYAEVDGKEYKIDTDFKIALKCFEIIDDNTIDEYEQVCAIVYLLFDFIPEDENLIIKLFEKAKFFLQCGKDDEEQKANKKDMDFSQDYGLIVSSFMSDYKIDLSKEKLHFWQFIDLLQGLTENSSLSRIRELRNYDLSEEKDLKRKKQIKEAQRKVALKKPVEKNKNFTANEISNMEEFYKLTNEGK